MQGINHSMEDQAHAHAATKKPTMRLPARIIPEPKLSP
jgi:hypothetical protein